MDDSEDPAVSTPTSPGRERRRRHLPLARHHSTGQTDEQTPLLSANNRGRVRIQADLLSPRAAANPRAYLARNQSYTGMSHIYIHVKGP